MATPTPTMRSATYALGYAGGVFYLTYTLTSLYAHALHAIAPLPDVATALDAAIPFIAPMIVLYALSLPLFVASFFVVCADDLSALTHRLILISLISGLIFYAYPLVFSFERTDFVWGVDWAWAYQILGYLDKPFNQLPSLHVGFAVLIFLSLFDTLRQKSTYYTVGLFLLCLGISVSTVFTYQHHLLDVLAGLLAAVVVFYLEKILKGYYPPSVKSCMIKYISVAVIWFLLWACLPVIMGVYGVTFYQLIAICGLMSFLAVVLAYHAYYYKNSCHFLGRLFVKHQGRLSIITQLLFLPLLGIYQTMWCFSKRQGFFYYQDKPLIIKDRLSIMVTGRPDKADRANIVSLAKHQHIIYIDVAAEMSLALDVSDMDYVYFPILDLADFDERHLSMLSHFCQQINDKIDPNIPTLIICQCAMGRSRSVGVMGFLLAYLGGFSADAIRAIIRTHQPRHHADIYLTDIVLTYLKDSHAR